MNRNSGPYERDPEVPQIDELIRDWQARFQINLHRMQNKVQHNDDKLTESS